MTTPVVFMHDGAVDELVCIPFLASMAPQIQLSSVWITPADCLGYPTASACQRLLNLLGQSSLPLFLSDSSSERPFPWEYRHGGGTVASLSAVKNNAPRVLPDITLTDLQGRAFRLKDLRGKPLLVEFWATWCPPCLQSMARMKELDTSKLNIVLIAIESDRKDIDAVLAKLQPPGRVVMATDAIRDAFDGPPAVPTYLLTDRDGKVARVFYGAPASIHEDITRELAKLR